MVIPQKGKPRNFVQSFLG